MTAHDQADPMIGRRARISLTSDFSPVITQSRDRKVFERLLACGCAATRLKPGVNEK
jgi:hypothetical protein